MRKKPKDKNDSTQNTRCVNQNIKDSNEEFRPPEGARGPGPGPRGRWGEGVVYHGEVVGAGSRDRDRASQGLGPGPGSGAQSPVARGQAPVVVLIDSHLTTNSSYVPPL